MRLWIARVLGAVLFGLPIAASYLFWWVWGCPLAYVLGLIAGDERQVRTWLSIQVGPTYASALCGPLWSYAGHEVERRRLVAYERDASLHCHVELSHVEHERAAFAFMRVHTEPIYNSKGSESFPLEGGHHA